MPAFITQRPEIDIGGNTSRWNAVTNPVIFKVERRDLDILGTEQDGAFVKINSVAFGIELLGKGGGVGSRIYLNSGPYDEVGEVLTVAITGITLNIDFQSTSSGGYVNFNTDRDNYRIQARILKIIGIAYVVVATTGSFKPNELGRLDIDVRSWLKTLPQMKNEFQYDEVNQRDINLGGRYNFQIRELFQDGGGADPFIGEFPDPLDGNLNFFINAARQIQDEHGGNMGQFTPFEITVTEAQKMKFLSGFVEPTRFEGFPFDLQFIYNIDLENHPTVKEERGKNINDVLTDTKSNQLDNAHINDVNRLTLAESYDESATDVEVFLTTDFNQIDVPSYAGNKAGEYFSEDYDGAPAEAINPPTLNPKP